MISGMVWCLLAPVFLLRPQRGRRRGPRVGRNRRRSSAWGTRRLATKAGEELRLEPMGCGLPSTCCGQPVETNTGSRTRDREHVCTNTPARTRLCEHVCATRLCTRVRDTAVHIPARQTPRVQASWIAEYFGYGITAFGLAISLHGTAHLGRIFRLASARGET